MHVFNCPPASSTLLPQMFWIGQPVVWVCYGFPGSLLHKWIIPWAQYFSLVLIFQDMALVGGSVRDIPGGGLPDLCVGPTPPGVTIYGNYPLSISKK